MTQQNAALVEETASASEEMANQAQELLSLVDNFKLKETINLEMKDLTLKNKSEQKTIMYDDMAVKETYSILKNDEGSDNIREVMEEDGFEEF